MREFHHTPAETRHRRRGRLGVHRQRWGEEDLPDTAGRGDGRRGRFYPIPASEDRYRVIAPSYASVSTAAELLDGLADLEPQLHRSPRA